MDDYEERSEQQRLLVENALGQAVSELRGGMVTKWIAIFEFIDEDGDRGLATMSTDELMRWDVTGMLDYTLNGNHAARIAAFLNEDGGAQ